MAAEKAVAKVEERAVAARVAAVGRVAALRAAATRAALLAVLVVAMEDKKAAKAV